VEAVLATAAKQVEAGEEVLAHVTAWERESNQCHVIACPWSNEQEKSYALRMITLFFLWKGVDRYIILSEAWMVTRSAEQFKEHRGPVSEEPDHQEVIVVNGVGPDGVLGAMMPIVRDGSVAAVGPVQWNDVAGGRLLQLLPPPHIKPSPAEMAALGEMFRGAQFMRVPL